MTHPPCTGCDDPTCPNWNNVMGQFRCPKCRDRGFTVSAFGVNTSQVTDCPCREPEPACDREHVTSASFQGLVRAREELRQEVEILEARLQDNERRMSECAASCEAEARKAREAAIEECAKVVDEYRAGWSDDEADGYLEPAAEMIRALKGGGSQ